MVGIYLITNTFNGKVYVGQSNDLERRKNQHFSALEKGKHENKIMQRDYNLHPDAFTFKVLEECYVSLLNVQEKYWIDYYRAADERYGYNGTKGGGSRSRKVNGRKTCLLDEITS